MLDASVPEFIRRYSRIQLLVLVIWLALGIGLGLLRWYGVNLLPVPGVYSSILLVPMFAYLLIARASGRALRRAAAADHLLCPGCADDLRTLDATGTCPECGRAYQHAAVRAQWLAAERRLKQR